MSASTPPRLLRIAAVLDRVGLSKRTMLTLVEKGAFPKPVRPSRGTVAWIEAEVDGWIRDRITERDEGRAA
ncbi:MULTISPECIES: helix-turn-helix transcriptional regulator [unclassified Aureimonas]|uniref:helix-turn-helix transcriptional regulator n=1 Tax=unclassified Aureimonas TaxID=2615206 RepID=UPI0006FD33AA|nr:MULTISPECIES: AlpA family phage regulatory protein [unclassified Aureimonas]KQT60374.1 hypothetical protein ASG62_06870 [Aureimonas sp. Leaf427]KQT79252.1 hypothetical protein ASG54_09470 [Aureimonas sp. Leaf460]